MSSIADSPAPATATAWRVGRRLAGYLPRYYLGGGLVWIGFYTVPIAAGLVLQRLFDELSNGLPAGLDAALWLCAAFVAVEAVRGGLLGVMLIVWPYWWNAVATLLRVNVLRSLLGGPGPAATRLPRSSGEAVSRFRDDVEDLLLMTDLGVDLAGTATFAAIAFTIMAGIDPLVTVVLVLPLTAALVATRAMSDVIKRWHGEARRLGAAVTAFIGDLFGGVLAVKTAGAEDAVLERLRRHNRYRRNAAVRDRLALDLLDTVTGTTVDISIGLVLLLAAPAMRTGDFTVGDFALFLSYAGWLTMFPRILGRMLYRVRQGAVATERLTRLLAAGETADDLVQYRPVWFRSPPPPPTSPTDLDGDRLRSLVIDGLEARHGGPGGPGIERADLRLERGSFTVVTGAVGSGKTTLVRAVLGLLPATAGTIRWNGRPVADPGEFLVPPRAAYAGQVPRLFSASLRENLVLGWPTDDDDLAAAIRHAALEDDVAVMPDGLETLVGPRGVRLSGGQVQRATAARALVRAPELLVVDDLSSALDVETEELLWRRLAAAAAAGTGPQTLLVVSHRAAALRRADQVVVLDRGRVVGCGPLDALLDSCKEMRRLWAEELVVEAEEGSLR
jgi:ATP-binding cassette subfamily B protein